MSAVIPQAPRCFLSVRSLSLLVVLLLLPLQTLADAPETFASSGSAYTVSDVGRLQRAAKLRRVLKAQGGEEISSYLGTILLYAPPQAGLHSFKQQLKEVLPDVVAEIDDALWRNPFHWRLRTRDYPIQIFLEKRSKTAAGMLSSERCHAAWMGPPANIFLSVDAFQSTCRSKGSSQLTTEQALRNVLVHEIAHAIEFRLMGEGFPRRKRWHSEGFASWFEQLKPGWHAESLLGDHPFELFRDDWNPAAFAGTRADYARSYAFVAALIEAQSIEGLLAVYGRMDRERLGFEEAVREEFRWDLKRWNQEVRSWLLKQRVSPAALVAARLLSSTRAPL